MAHDYLPLFAHVEAVTEEMDDLFSSHEFIQRLMWRQQGLFIDALRYHQADQPFRKVHARISRHLGELPKLITYAGHRASPNIFGEVQGCAFWQKVGTPKTAPIEPNLATE